MTERTTTRSVVFRHSFVLGAGEGPYPAGTYLIETDEELIPGLSFQAYRRIRTTMKISVEQGLYAKLQVIPVDPSDLEAALARDAASAPQVT